MAKYRKKPVEVEAVQFIGFNNDGEAIFDCDDGDHTESWLWGNWQNNTIRYCDSDNGTLVLETTNEVVQMEIGDYVVRNVDGLLFSCKPDIFEKTYEKI
ncbi:MAG: hypothetical protein ACRC76_11940 [Proteocatella sp.]